MIALPKSVQVTSEMQKDRKKSAPQKTKKIKMPSPHARKDASTQTAKKAPNESSINRSSGNGLSQYFLEPHSGIGTQMSLTEQVEHSGQAKFDPMTSIPAETKSLVMPAIIKIAREIRLRFDLPLALRSYLAGGSGSVNLSISPNQAWKIAAPRGDPYLRSVLFDRLTEMAGDPIITESFVNSELKQLRVKIRVLLPETDGNHCKTSSQEDYEIDGYEISLIFRPPCPPKSVAWNLLAAQNDDQGNATLNLNLLSIIQIPAELQAREQAEKELNRKLKAIRQSPAFNGIKQSQR